jgi:hypothetical protein
MRTLLIVFLTTLLIFGCSNAPRNGIEISNGQFHQLIRTQSIASITFLTKKMAFEIELTDGGREQFSDQIDKLSKDGGLKQPSDFRLFHLVAGKEFAIERIREIEKESELPPLDIKTED